MAALQTDRRNRRTRQDGHERAPTLKIAAGIAVVLILFGSYWELSGSGALPALGDEEILQGLIGRLGPWGPVAVVTLMAAAIVMSPIPSGPIGLAAGAAYGPIWGTLCIIAGAEAGALMAFAIARFVGFGAVRRRLKGRLSFLTRPRSQAALMAIVFASRLVPFISFDAVSYGAGLTPLSFWRFAVATLAGVVPISFLIAYFGDELVSAGSWQLMIAAVLVGGITLAPIAIRFSQSRRK
ncbi:MAG TPA: TVP38/TMEM64 family protein [Alphaproteobacteria bacterium]|nr:TVP38/TMEM64 family protein [Alphaproteobacteria bacterium]